MSRERRARLPGADELFKSTMARPEDEFEGVAPAAPRESPTDLDERALTQLITLAAAEDEVQVSARQAQHPDGPSVATGSLLTWLAAMVEAKHIVAVGSHGGTLGLWLLRGMAQGGMLTSISPGPAEQARAREVFGQAHTSDRVRAIAGSPADVLPRLSDGGYDLLVWAGGIDKPDETRDHTTRLVRSGGALAVLDVARDTAPDVRGRRTLVRDLIEDPRWTVAVLPVDDGVALARRS